MIKRLKCKLGYHKYYTLIELSKWSRKLGCHNCNKCFAMNNDVRSVLPWDGEFETLYKMIGAIKNE